MTLYPEKITNHILDNPEFAIPNSALSLQFKYDKKEESHEGFLDPIGDQIHAKGGGVIHRYQNRILFTPTTACPVNCRYCFRKNELFSPPKFLKPKIEQLVKYLSEHKEVEEVILTGGDPLVLSNAKFLSIIKHLEKTHIKYLRIHTRTPIASPERIDDELVQILSQAEFRQVFFVLHTNHISELTTPVELALRKLPEIMKLTQTVLLKNVNDNANELKILFNRVSEIGFKPYYLHHPDKVKGAMHFYLSQEQGKEIYRQLRNIISGWALPHYIIDSPEGSGKKLTINPNY